MDTTVRLSGLLNLIDRWRGFPALAERLAKGERVPVALAEGAKPYLLAALQRRLAVPILVVTARPGRAREVQEQTDLWSAGPGKVLLFPEPDSLPYERMPEDAQATAERLATLSAMAAWKQPGDGGGEGAPPVVVACVRAMMEFILSPEQLRASTFSLRVGQRVRLQALLKQWAEQGYEATPVVESPGSFSRRGGILDVFPPGSPAPYRIELFGDEVESIRTFDPTTQRSSELVLEVAVSAPHEVLPSADPEILESLRLLDCSRCTPTSRESFERDLEMLSRGQAPSAPGFFRAFLGRASLLDYLPAGGLLVLDDPSQIDIVARELQEQAAHLEVQAAERGEIPAGLPPALRSWEELAARAGRGRWPVLEVRYDPGAEATPFQAPPAYGGKLEGMLDDLLAGRTGGHGSSAVDGGAGLSLPGGDGRGSEGSPIPPRSIVLVSQQSERLAELMAERDLPVTSRQGLQEEPAPGIYLLHGSLRHGWESQELGATVMGDSEIFGWTKARRVARRRSAPREAFLSDLVEGELAVHIEHGIGRFLGLQRMSSDGQEREYLVLQYAEGDRLYVPSDQVDRVARYIGAGDDGPTLSRLGTSEWARAKERVRNSVRNVARELLEVYSARQSQPGYAFSPDSPWQGELETSFPYVETPDQLQAIQDVKAEMEAPRPMDRLICGDVGYGKTEVALRAAFKAVMDGKQVAVLVPTTVLAQQHFSTFSERLQPFPVKVEVLSRFRSEKEQRKVLEGLQTGEVDICIGTHRLIQKDIQFKDLGLVIVDEEQRFGVMHKERLKQLRQQVDVLTLSATPIPRTLHMSLAGIRDMSTMETPPEDRLPIRTFVAEYSDATVREALLREMDRGGQVYFVHSRVQNIYFIASHLKNLVPEARIAVGHGQMPEDGLERVMLEFADGQHDVLVCTTIIESGLDIPNVNTIIVNNADRFGLAQLYQLRGRVGRGANRAYAYFLYSRSKQLTETAEKRLKTIFENTELGSGFRIAMRDLEIRGAGNLLGVEQHGQVNAVGFDLYTRLLADAVSELQGKPRPEEVVVTVDLPLTAHLPGAYVTDEASRLSLYQRLAAVKKDEDLGQMVEETQDRFGAMPVEAQNLFYTMSVKLMAQRIGIPSIGTVDGEIVLKLDGIPLPIRNSLQRRFGHRVRALPNQVRIRRESGASWMPVLQEVLEELEQAAGRLRGSDRLAPA